MSQWIRENFRATNHTNQEVKTMDPKILEIKWKPVPKNSPLRVALRVWDGGGTVPMDEGTLAQAQEIAQLPFVFKHVALMPDAHFGMGSTVGSVVATKGAVIPAAVGVDIGCGMLAYETPWSAMDLLGAPLDEIRAAIEAAVPHGRTAHGKPEEDLGSWRTACPEWIQRYYGIHLRDGLNRLDGEAFAKGRSDPHLHAWNMLGTLGTGNHFIEVSLDERDRAWVVLHSGSRGIGHRIASYYMKLAKEKCHRWHVDLPNEDLAFFPEGEKEYDDYLTALTWAQQYAWHNRSVMLELVLDAMVGMDFARRWIPPLGNFGAGRLIHCHHNYAAIEHHFGENVIVTRKGAVRAREGDKGIIPGSMGAKSFIVEGLGNPESFHSCSHGAGRVMSRTQARRSITVEQHAADTTGVHCDKSEMFLDESPRAYKDIDAVMAAQTDLVRPIVTLKQVICVKG